MCGMQDNRNLLAKPNLTFQKALELAQLHESAEQMPRHSVPLPDSYSYREHPAQGCQLRRVAPKHVTGVVEDTTPVLVVFGICNYCQNKGLSVP